jgi:hypothetical protein
MTINKKDYDDWYKGIPEDVLTDPRVSTRLQSIYENTVVFSCRGTPLEKLFKCIIENYPVPDNDILDLIIDGNYILE